MTLERGRGPWTRTMFCIRLPCAVCGRRNRQVAGQTRRSATGDRSGVRRGARRSATRRYEPRRVGARAQQRSVTRAQMTTQRVAALSCRRSVCRLRELKIKRTAAPARGWSGHWWSLLDYHAHACAVAVCTTPELCVSLMINRRVFRLFDLSRKMFRDAGGLKIVTRGVGVAAASRRGRAGRKPFR